MANEVMIPLEQIGMMAKAVSDSGLFGIKSEAAAFSLMCIAQADGIPPIKAAVQYHIIDGKPALKSEAMLARFQASGGKIRWKERNPNRCTLWLEHPNAGELEVTWDMERAKAAGLAGRNTWKAFPAQMMSARCISEGIRALYPACVGGFYTPEEVRDFDAPPPAAQPKIPKPAPTAKAAKQATQEAEIIEDGYSEPPVQTDAFAEPPKTEAKEPAQKPENPAKAAEKPRDVKLTRTPEVMKANFMNWAESACLTKDRQKVMDAIGAMGYESFDQVPPEKDVLREVTKAISAVPDIPMGKAESPF
ncbi:hypothetical protein [Fibrobacter intestinalis]|uniref:Phage recombination protein Bet n=1 Tax=Fibrobacter intestinalis TaxID=28122 RepID=A0A1T4S2V5_9BACT|nr:MULTISPECIES: hypothetical protein [Fibrobacter]PBC73079.1 hypothetical protein BGW94_0668 [Fibrobacter sp. NR9]PBC75317.1 hypothetical protein BGW94_3005 [Fibrobacter sp. NR9]SKA22416.1 hypothetical protein SAMN02745108_02947 [Fibrobacter intestinalis]